MSSSWRRVPSRLFRSCSACFLCELHSGSSLRWRFFALCESPMAENWQTKSPETMQHRHVKRASVNYTVVRLYSSGASLCVNDQQLGELWCQCGISVWKGLLIAHRADFGLEVVSAFSHHETGLWIWMSRFRFQYMCPYSPAMYTHKLI